MFKGSHLFPIRPTSLAMVPDKDPFQRTIFPAATARHGELDGTTTGEASLRPAGLDLDAVRPIRDEVIR